MEEIWKDIKGYEGLYQVSNLGNVKSQYKNKILNPSMSEYKRVVLYKNKKPKTFSIHKLVAETFIPNLYSYNMINHINENKYDNRIENLEWCSHKYNDNYGKRNEKLSKTQSKYKIVQKDTKGNIIKIWDYIWDIYKNTNYKKNTIRCCCQNKLKTAYGYKWEYLKRN